MIKVFRGKSALKRAGLAAYFGQLRYQTFIQASGWPLGHRAGEEWDCYDSDDAVYFLAFDATGQITGGVRLIPTTSPFLMEEIFPHLIDPSVSLPKGPQVMELTRYFVAPMALRSRRLISIVGSLLCGMLEWSLDEGLESILVVMDMTLFSQLKEVGWKFRPMGLPQDFGGGGEHEGGGTVLAISVDVNRQSLVSTARARRIGLPVLPPIDRHAGYNRLLN